MKINTVAINPNINPNYPDDAPDKMIQKIQELGIDFPYLVDETQDTARSFKAQCTPDIYLFDKIKSSRTTAVSTTTGRTNPGSPAKSSKKPSTTWRPAGLLICPRRPSMGCSIKWSE